MLDSKKIKPKTDALSLPSMLMFQEMRLLDGAFKNKTHTCKSSVANVVKGAPHRQRAEPAGQRTKTPPSIFQVLGFADVFTSKSVHVSDEICSS